MRRSNNFRSVVRCLDIELKLVSFETLSLCLSKRTLFPITRFPGFSCKRPLISLFRLLRRGRVGQLGRSIDTC